MAYRDETERFALEPALAFFTPMRPVAQTAPAATVLDAWEPVALVPGCPLLRRTVADAIPTRIAANEQTGSLPAPAPARAATPAAPGGGTALGS
jgi:hypothetical protein